MTESSQPPSGPSIQDQALMRRVAMLLIEHASLLPYEESLRNILADENHPVLGVPTEDPELRALLKKTQIEQVAAIVNTLSIILRGHREMIEYFKRVDPEKRAAVARAMKNLGIEE